MNLSDLVEQDLGVGIGLRTVHYGHILEHWPELDWFEILSENYMHTGGKPLYYLDQIAERYPLVMHGVSLNLCSTDEIDVGFLKELCALRERSGSRFLSDHLCWTGVGGKNLHDLLPVPYTEAALAHTIQKIGQVQDVIEAPLVIENPSTYLEFKDSSMSEWEFISRMARESGCGLLLDVNNIYVCAQNHGFDPYEYLDNTAWDHVVQFHIAGHTRFDTHLLDTHSGPGCDEVWDLYRHAVKLSGGRSTLFEWDADIPGFDEVKDQAMKARRIRDEVLATQQEAARCQTQAPN
jgi:uncharacterized protein (UPF0276 family)